MTKIVNCAATSSDTMNINAQERAHAVTGFRHTAALLTQKAETTTHKRDLLVQHAFTMTQIADTLERGDTLSPSVFRLWRMMLTSSLALLDVRGEL